ncbi:hypothetical protein HD554DRAFT_518557 [Boletus coccyginus]|nr:hypothetical protein HD554DRAFT_518557 [Boletus coccyginus]
MIESDRTRDGIRRDWERDGTRWVGTMYVVSPWPLARVRAARITSRRSCTEQACVRACVCYSETEMNSGRTYGHLGAGHATCDYKKGKRERERNGKRICARDRVCHVRYKNGKRRGRARRKNGNGSALLIGCTDTCSLKRGRGKRCRRLVERRDEKHAINEYSYLQTENTPTSCRRLRCYYWRGEGFIPLLRLGVNESTHSHRG